MILVTLCHLISWEVILCTCTTLQHHELVAVTKITHTDSLNTMLRSVKRKEIPK